MIRRLLAAIAIVALLAGCAGGTGAGTSAPVASAVPPPGPAVERTRAAIESALGARSVQLQNPQVPYRPAEPPAVAALPRAVYQAVLPADPTHGFIVVYELPDPETATAAARAQAAYVASPVGRVQFATGTRFIVRQLGSTVVFYAAPPESPDDQAPDVVAALETVGTGIEVPS